MADKIDVIVVGLGNAAICAALSATEQGARVLMLEKAPIEERGGNSLFTAGGFRFVHDGLDDLRHDILNDLSAAEAEQIILPTLPAQTYLDDLMRVTEHNSDETLAGLLVGRSRDTMRWMRHNGVRFIPMFGRQSYKLNGKHHFYGGVNIEAVGGGWGLVDQLLKAAERQKIEIRYATRLVRLLQDRRGAVTGVTVKGPDGYADIDAKAVVLACGGFEANPEMRTRYLGPGWELCRVRGTRHNTGDGIKAALDIGAQPFGGWSTCHAVAWDISAPPFGDRTVLDNFQKHSYPIGIVVNLNGERFVDEGADFRNHTYAKYGREIMKQPQRAAVQIFDAKTIDMVRDEYRIRQVTKAQADTIEGLAQQLDIDPEGLARTVTAFNAACQPGDYNPAILDGKGTKGITPPKSNWALPIDRPPYTGFVVTCGITFTFGGLRINEHGGVLDVTDAPIPGLYAAGELVGGIFYGNYLGGAGLMSGAVFGRLSGHSAGQHARS
ncbi:FAD-dependent tricarballylate dehydrogenase TcuA [Reyranella sp. CPCC 100927]|uniref:FAD-dependent tricarballylate dehydrogenase TcuA n=1 Tax=Reyranella sp. CPCC 100927 TaxID=2599616 RepID=UPI0011B3708C|nr:FAD-dependent tricarballylate dehydrogenase TcuA [Reyranella sp. CPCC 100927]TWT03088.1 FAD-binding dehydrogenase [Reyranella sp. CPCC 100927]